ncbi:hypothetical protein ES703_33051 [subsurface metagenome]
MVKIDSECNAIVNLFSTKSVKAKYPVYVKSENPLFKRKGTSFNLKNVREYQPFDDLRRIDWKLYGRTDRYYIKEFFEEENERFFFLIDSSASIHIFDRDYYKSFIASLAYIFLKLHFSISLVSFNTRIGQTSLNIKEEKNISRVLIFLDKLRFEQKTDLMAVLKSVRNNLKPNTVFLFSDLFDRGYTPDTAVHFRRICLLHFFTSLSELAPEPGEVEIEDRELGKRLLLPYNYLNQKRINELEEQFIKKLARSRKNYYYYLIRRSDHRIPFYWRILESLYG